MPTLYGFIGSNLFIDHNQAFLNTLLSFTRSTSTYSVLLDLSLFDSMNIPGDKELHPVRKYKENATYCSHTHMTYKGICLHNIGIHNL